MKTIKISDELYKMLNRGVLVFEKNSIECLIRETFGIYLELKDLTLGTNICYDCTCEKCIFVNCRKRKEK